MNTVSSKVLGAGVFFLIIFLTGFLLSQSGRPLNTIVFTIHKLVAVGAVVFLAVTVYRTNQVAGLSTVALAAAAITGLLFLGTIVTGGLLSIGQSVPSAILTMHQITPFLTVLSTAWLLWSVLPTQEPVIP
jgi:hypothetical protein